MIPWDDVSDEFAWEGSWRDICLQETSISDWRAVWRVLRSGGLELTYAVDDVKTAPPENVDEVFAQPREHTFLAAIVVAGVHLNCHFFSELEIEFDLDPREITHQVQLDAVIAFMATLASATGRIALMTPENTHDAPFLRVAPSGVTEYISTSGFFRELAAQER
ncbi:MAG: hypothetical protein ACOY0T_22545 [Myxococcota bacterium]